MKVKRIRGGLLIPEGFVSQKNHYSRERMKFTKVELRFIDLNYQLFNDEELSWHLGRKPRNFRTWRARNGYKLHNEGLTTYDLKRKLGLCLAVLKQARIDGKLKASGKRRKTKTSPWLYSFENVADYVRLHHPYKEITCLSCRKKIKGDIFCLAHKPRNWESTLIEKFETHTLRHSKGTFKEAIAKAIKHRRNKLGMTQKDLGEKLLYDRQWVYRYETGSKQLVDVDELLDIFKALNMEMKIILEEY